MKNDMEKVTETPVVEEWTGKVERPMLNCPKSLANEYRDLKNLYEFCLKKAIRTFGTDCIRRFTTWDFYQTLSGQRFDNPKEWLGKVVEINGHPEFGRGIIVAIKKVETLYIPGVEFDRKLRNGHALDFRTDGIRGREGHCRWIYLDDIKTVDKS